MLVLAVAGGAWALFGRGTDKKGDSAAIGPVAASGTPTKAVVGPPIPGATKAVTPTSTKPVAAATTAAPTASKPAPTAAATTKAPAPTATAPAPAPATSTPPATTKPPVTKPPVTAPQQAGTVAKKAYTFRVARGDTLWGFAKSTLAATGRSTSNASVASYVAKLYSANSSTIGSNPNLIYAGEKVVWPAGL